MKTSLGLRIVAACMTVILSVDPSSAMRYWPARSTVHHLPSLLPLLTLQALDASGEWQMQVRQLAPHSPYKSLRKDAMGLRQSHLAITPFGWLNPREVRHATGDSPSFPYEKWRRWILKDLAIIPDAQVLEEPLDTLRLSEGVVAALSRYQPTNASGFKLQGVKTIRDLIEFWPQRLERLKGVGRVGVIELAERLMDIGIYWGDAAQLYRVMACSLFLQKWDPLGLSIAEVFPHEWAEELSGQHERSSGPFVHNIGELLEYPIQEIVTRLAALSRGKNGWRMVRLRLRILQDLLQSRYEEVPEEAGGGHVAIPGIRLQRFKATERRRAYTQILTSTSWSPDRASHLWMDSMKEKIWLSLENTVVCIVAGDRRAKATVVDVSKDYVVLWTNAHVVEGFQSVDVYRDIEQDWNILESPKLGVASVVLKRYAGPGQWKTIMLRQRLTTWFEQEDFGDSEDQALLVMARGTPAIDALVPVPVLTDYDLLEGSLGILWSNKRAAHSSGQVGYFGFSNDKVSSLKDVFLFDAVGEPGNSGKPCLVKIQGKYYCVAVVRGGGETKEAFGDIIDLCFLSRSVRSAMLQAVSTENPKVVTISRPKGPYDVRTKDPAKIAAVVQFLRRPVKPASSAERVAPFVPPTNPLSLDMTWLRLGVERLFLQWNRRPPAWVIAFIVSMIEPLLLWAGAAHAVEWTRWIVGGFGFAHWDYPIWFTPIAGLWSYGVIAFFEHSPLNVVSTYLLIASAQFGVTLFLQRLPYVKNIYHLSLLDIVSAVQDGWINRAARGRQQRAYQEAWEKTKSLQKAPEIFQAGSNQEYLSIALRASTPGQVVAVSDFSPERIVSLSGLIEELRGGFPFLDPVLPTVDALHLNLFISFLLQPFKFLENSSFEVRTRAYRSAIRAWKHYGPVEVEFRGINFMANGDLILEGHIRTAALERLREELFQEIRLFEPQIKKMGLFSHMTLARSAASTWNDFVRLRDWVAGHRNTFFGKITIHQPQFFAYSDYNGRTVHPAAQEELSPFNRELQLWADHSRSGPSDPNRPVRKSIWKTRISG
jgi:hypothetical protein